VDENRLSYAGWPVVAACSVGVFFATVPIHTFGVFLQPLCDQFSWSRESASSAYGTLTLLAAVSAPCLGWLLDRFGARRVSLPSLALSGLAVASLSLLTAELWQLRATFGLLGLVMMGASPIAYSRAIFGWFDARRGRALGVMLAGAAVSGIVLPPTARALIDITGWRLAWLALGLGTLLVALPIAVAFLRDANSRDRASAAQRQHTAGVSVADALGTRVFWTLAVVMFLHTLASNAALVHVVALLVDRGVPPSQAALAVSAMGAASLAGRLLTGALLDRFAATRVAVALLSIAALGTFILADAGSFLTGALAVMCIGFGTGGEVDVTPYLLSRHFGLKSLSTLYGLTWTAWGVAGAAGPLLLGRAFDATGSYAIALSELGFITLVAAGLMLTIPAAPRAVLVHR
jgi:MFS family permease